MSQTLHILKKDIRYLRFEILLVLAGALLYVVGETARVNSVVAGPLIDKLVFVLAGAYLLAKVIHAEAIPGDTKFWTTRPYAWKQLLLEKIVFIFLFINVPLIIARLIVLLAVGFPLREVVIGLFWWQALVFLVVELPLAALAAMTEGIASFMVSLLFAWAGLALRSIVLLTVQGSRFSMPPGVQWIPEAATAVIFLATTALILYTQYKGRRTGRSRAYSVGALVLGVVAPLLLTPAVAFGIQTRLSTGDVDPASLKATVETIPDTVIRRDAWSGQYVIVVTGIPDGMQAVADHVDLTADPDSEPALELRALGLPRADVTDSGTVRIRGLLVTKSEVARPQVVVRGSVALTLFGLARSTTIARFGRIDLPELQCSLNFQLVCRTAFGWPAGLLYADAPKGKSVVPWPGVSYSPVPVELSTVAPEGITMSVPTAWNPFLLNSSKNPLTLTFMKPVAHVRVPFENQVTLAP